MKHRHYGHLKLRGKIAEEGHSLTSLSELTGFAVTTLSAKLAGRRPFDVVDIQRLCEALNIPESDIVKYFFREEQ